MHRMKHEFVRMNVKVVGTDLGDDLGIVFDVDRCRPLARQIGDAVRQAKRTEHKKSNLMNISQSIMPAICIIYWGKDWVE